jgi:hypothetical protein
MPRLGFMRRLALTAAVALVVAGGAAGAAYGYWDFQGNLPKSDGSRIYVKYTNVSPGGLQDIRMSWTTGSHCMRFLWIHPSGSWSESAVCGSDPCYPNYYDCEISWGPTDSIYDRFGCENPPNLSTVWVNCRATNPL